MNKNNQRKLKAKINPLNLGIRGQNFLVISWIESELSYYGIEWKVAFKKVKSPVNPTDGLKFLSWIEDRFDEEDVRGRNQIQAVRARRHRKQQNFNVISILQKKEKAKNNSKKNLKHILAWRTYLFLHFQWAAVNWAF